MKTPMTGRQITRASKQLSWLLRHGAGEVGLEMDAAGWCRVDDVLGHVRIDAAQLLRVVERNNKSRLQLDHGRIRASQGHSTTGMPVTQDALEASWTRFTGTGPIWHGTQVRAAFSILASGILPAARTHVHLAAETDSVVGKRTNVGVMLGVDPQRMSAHGFGVFVSPNGVLLAREVPADCIVEIQCISRKAKACENALRRAQVI